MASLKGAIVAASNGEHPDVILIEGQGALSHPAFCTSAFILRGSQPDAVILQHAPKRAHRCDFPSMPMPDPADEIALIEAFADTKVIGVTINHEGMTRGRDRRDHVGDRRENLGLASDRRFEPPRSAYLAEIVLSAYPELRKDAGRRPRMTAPRIEIDLGKIRQNTQSLVEPSEIARDQCHRRDQGCLRSSCHCESHA